MKFRCITYDCSDVDVSVNRDHVMIICADQGKNACPLGQHRAKVEDACNSDGFSLSSHEAYVPRYSALWMKYYCVRIRKATLQKKKKKGTATAKPRPSAHLVLIHVA